MNISAAAATGSGFARSRGRIRGRVVLANECSAKDHQNFAARRVLPARTISVKCSTMPGTGSPLGSPCHTNEGTQAAVQNIHPYEMTPIPAKFPEGSSVLDFSPGKVVAPAKLGSVNSSGGERLCPKSSLWHSSHLALSSVSSPAAGFSCRSGTVTTPPHQSILGALTGRRVIIPKQDHPEPEKAC